METVHQERRLTIILSADVVGYSDMMNRNEIATLLALKKLRRDIMDPKIHLHRGNTIKLLGDGSLVEFNSVVDALRFAVDFQHSAMGSQSDVEEQNRLRLRIGINIGDVIVDGNDIYGDGVNIAARIEGLADPQGVCISRSVFEQVVGKLDLDMTSMGIQSLKNIPTGVEVFRVNFNEKSLTVAEAVPEISAPEDAPPKAGHNLKQTVRYATSPMGDASIAWSVAGTGAPLLFGSHHLSHLEQDPLSSLLGPLFQVLARDHQLIRYDIRGSGLSDSMLPGDTFDTHVSDLKVVADAAELERFPIVAALQSAAVAIRFAAENPERVSRLVILTGYAQGRNRRKEAVTSSENDPFITLLKSGGWGDPQNGFMRAWATMIMPELSPEEITELITMIRMASSPEDALVQRDIIDELDVTSDLPRVTCPTLVIHARRCTIHPATEGRRVAAGIPGAEFLEVDSSNAFCVAGNTSFDQQMEAAKEFLTRES